MYPSVIPNIPNTAGITGGAGIGSLNTANSTPTNIPVPKDNKH
jgi:hypothetical protein